MIKLLNCPECKYCTGLRSYARTSCAIEVTKDGSILDSGENSAIELTDEIFCSNCGIDLKLEQVAGKFRLAKVPEAKFKPYKPKVMSKILSALTGDSRASITS